ncbi:MAG: DUF2267 domain-containing protein [Cyanobacteria bacterium J06555_13]
MTTTGVIAFDRTLHATHSWLNALDAELDWDDKRKVLQALRITLHALRDRLSVDQASKLAAQFPILLSGIYYENWMPATTPHKERTKDAFVSHIEGQLHQMDPNIDSEFVVRSVFKVIANKVSPGEVEDVKSMLPKPLKALWPSKVSA